MLSQHLVLMIFKNTHGEQAHPLCFYQLLNYQRYIPAFGMLQAMIVRVIFLSLLPILIIIKSGAALAFKGTESIEITSDNLIVDDQNLFASFKGSVTVTLEDMILKTDYLKIHYANNKGKKSIDKIEIPGKLKAIKTSCQEVVIADSGEYNSSLNELLLKGNVRVQKDNNILITDKMIYITKLKSLSQKSDEN